MTDSTQNLLVRGGRVVDGTGTAARAADVRVRAGVIAEIGTGLTPDGERVIDAGGALVAPGFFDNHTHVDPSLFWDTTADPLPQHGITTALMGNCSLSLAPVRARDRAGVTSLFCYIEDLPEAAFDESIPWNWETYAEYAAAVDGQRLSIDAIGFLGHTPLRLFVMGDEAWERAATESERQQMAALLDEGLRAGAMGLSTSQGFDEDRNKRPVPSRLADEAELDALFAVLGAHHAPVQFIPNQDGGRAMTTDVVRVGELTRRHGIAGTWIGIFHNRRNPKLALRQLDHALEMQRSGIRTYPQVSPRTLDIRVNWAGGMSFYKIAETWHKMVQSGPADKRAMLADPQWLGRARAEWDDTPFTMIPHKHPERLRLVEVTDPRLERWVGATLADLMAERGGHPSDVLAQWVLDNDLAPGVIGIGVVNDDQDGVAETLVHPAALLGNSDAGAHLQMMCAIGDSTLLLTRHVRERGDLALEDAVAMLTGRQADAFNFADRGIVEVGRRGDLTIFVLDELMYEEDSFVADLPAGGARLRRPGGGYRYTVVAGEVTQEGNTVTAARPGRFGRPRSAGA